jgi:Secretion system C-terminal sorting domain
MKLMITLLFASLSLIVYAQGTAQLEEQFMFYDDFGSSQNVILGYDPFGTDGLDTSLGEEFIPQVPSGQFGVRFILPADTNITTIKDIRYGCGQPFMYNHLVELSYEYSDPITVAWDSLGWEIMEVDIINPYNDQVLETINWYDGPGEFTIPSGLSRILLRVYYNGPLSWPSYGIYYPTGGESFEAGSDLTINYVFNLPTPTMTTIEFSSDEGNTWMILDSYYDPFATSHTVTLPDVNSTHCLIRLGNYPCYYAVTLGDFTVYQGQPPTLVPFISSFTIKNGQGAIKTLTFGLHPDATPGIDSSLGELPIPPPPPGEFDATFYIQYQYRSRVDLRTGYIGFSGTRYSELKVQPTSDNIVILDIDIPQGLSVELNYPRGVPGGYGYKDTILTTGYHEYQFDSTAIWNNNSLGDGIIFHYNNVVPVDLTSFTVMEVNSNVSLNWTTATETNNKGFEVERLKDSKIKKLKNTWTMIGFVDGHGTTTQPRQYNYEDKNVTNGSYLYRLKQIDFDGTYKYSKEVEVEVNVLLQFSLSQNYPNPFNPSTKIKYSIPKDGNVSLCVYNILGQQVVDLVNENMKAGRYEVTFDASKFASGVYYYRLQSDNRVMVKKMIVLK